jgi:hypothetical protein
MSVHTCSKSTLLVFMRCMRSWTAAWTTALEGFMRLKTHHLVAPTTLSGDTSDCLNCP